MSSLGATIRSLRERRKLTQSALAAAADLTPNYVAMVERGERLPSVKAIVALAAALNVPPLKLLRSV
jgi:transcriptional regulator with XRE-family HTH domain